MSLINKLQNTRLEDIQGHDTVPSDVKTYYETSLTNLQAALTDIEQKIKDMELVKEQLLAEKSSDKSLDHITNVNYLLDSYDNKKDVIQLNIRLILTQFKGAIICSKMQNRSTK